MHTDIFQASMLSTPDGPFINLGRLNFTKYASRQNLAKALFEYIFHHENDVRNVCTIWFSCMPLDRYFVSSQTKKSACKFLFV